MAKCASLPDTAPTVIQTLAQDRLEKLRLLPSAAALAWTRSTALTSSANYAKNSFANSFVAVSVANNQITNAGQAPANPRKDSNMKTHTKLTKLALLAGTLLVSGLQPAFGQIVYSTGFEPPPLRGGPAASRSGRLDRGPNPGWSPQPRCRSGHDLQAPNRPANHSRLGWGPAALGLHNPGQWRLLRRYRLLSA